MIPGFAPWPCRRLIRWLTLSNGTGLEERRTFFRSRVGFGDLPRSYFSAASDIEGYVNRFSSTYIHACSTGLEDSTFPFTISVCINLSLWALYTIFVRSQGVRVLAYQSHTYMPMFPFHALPRSSLVCTATWMHSALGTYLLQYINTRSISVCTKVGIRWSAQ